MERPQWGTVVGTIAAVLGAGGIMASAQAAFMPAMMEMQREFMEEIRESSEEDGGVPFHGALDKFYDLPPWYGTWSIVNGGVGVVLSAGCLVAGIFLLIVRTGAPRLLVLFSALSILWHTVRIGVGAVALSLAASSMIPTAIFGLVVHTVLISVVYKADQSAYTTQAA